jgi:hypothetical protein
VGQFPNAGGKPEPVKKKRRKFYLKFSGKPFDEIDAIQAISFESNSGRPYGRRKPF